MLVADFEPAATIYAFLSAVDLGPVVVRRVLAAGDRSRGQKGTAEEALERKSGEIEISLPFARPVFTVAELASCPGPHTRTKAAHQWRELVEGPRIALVDPPRWASPQRSEDMGSWCRRVCSFSREVRILARRSKVLESGFEESITEWAVGRPKGVALRTFARATRHGTSV